jgi:hypothetical protein
MTPWLKYETAQQAKGFRDPTPAKAQTTKARHGMDERVSASIRPVAGTQDPYSKRLLELEAMSATDVKKVAKGLGLTGYSKKVKPEVIREVLKAEGLG